MRTRTVLASKKTSTESVPCHIVVGKVIHSPPQEPLPLQHGERDSLLRNVGIRCAIRRIRQCRPEGEVTWDESTGAASRNHKSFADVDPVRLAERERDVPERLVDTTPVKIAGYTATTRQPVDGPSLTTNIIARTIVVVYAPARRLPKNSSLVWVETDAPRMCTPNFAESIRTVAGYNAGATGHEHPTLAASS